VDGEGDAKNNCQAIGNLVTAYFIDLDDVVTEKGTQRLLSGAKEALDRIAANGGAIFFFSCWAFDQNDVDFLRREFPYAFGYIRKPLADRYVYIDDKLDVAACGTSLK